MAGTYFPSIKMKRKDLDDVNHDFSDFSLSSPARKIRRLDVDLPPIMEEEVLESVSVVDQPSVAEEKRAIVDENYERAIVVYNHLNNHPSLLHSPSNFTVSVDSDFISGIKNKYPWSSRSNDTKPNEEETTNNNMAVVPWVPSQFIAQSTDLSGAQAPEIMDEEQVGESAMEIEDSAAETQQQRPESGLNVTMSNEGLHQWQQQQQQQQQHHCLIPQLPYNTSTPISWSR